MTMTHDPRKSSSRPSNVITFAPLREQIDRLFDAFAQAIPPRSATAGSFQFSPGSEIVETEQGFDISVELPGMSSADISVTATANTIMVSGEKRSTASSSDDYDYQSSRCFGGFAETFSLPTAIELDKVTADFRNGVLQIHAPKLLNHTIPTRTVPIDG